MLEPDIAHGKGTYRYDFRRPFEKYMKEIGFEWVTPHIMRHTFALLLAIKGVSLYKIANWPGDTLATTEKHYAHLLPTDPDIGTSMAQIQNRGNRKRAKSNQADAAKGWRVRRALRMKSFENLLERCGL
jgi:hypothetical protein